MNQLILEAYSNAVELIQLNKKTIVDLVEVLKRNTSLSSNNIDEYILENKIVLENSLY